MYDVVIVDTFLAYPKNLDELEKRQKKNEWNKRRDGHNITYEPLKEKLCKQEKENKKKIPRVSMTKGKNIAIRFLYFVIRSLAALLYASVFFLLVAQILG